MNRDEQRGMVSIMKSVYYPSVNERKQKARFWRLWNDGPTKGEPTVAAIEETLEETLSKKSDPAYLAWLLNTKEVVEQINTAYGVIMERILDMAVDPETKNGDLLKAASVLGDMIKYSAPKQEVKYADAAIAGMSEEELDKLLEGK